MASLNRVALIGNVGKDPEITYTKAGEPVANFSLATSESWTGKDGEKQERTEWHRVTVFGKLAQTVRDYVKKGDKLYLEGQIRYEEWNDKDGNKRNTTKIQLSGFNGKLVMLGSKPGSRTSEQVSESAPAGQDRPLLRVLSRIPTTAPHPETGFQATDDDVPF
jgi:single-strand DNA-binding protein